jgi:hypothetical protein
MRTRRTGSATGVAVFLAAIVAIVFSWNEFEISAMGPPLARSPAATGSELLQFASAGHVLGFEAGGVVAAASSHALRVAFVGANPVTPQRAALDLRGPETSEGSANRAPPLSSVTYPIP